MSVNAAVKTIRIAQMQPQHVATVNLLTSTPQTIAQHAASLGITQDDAEKRLSIAVDQALSVRSVGTRATATYTSA